jgi:glucose-6-phosphate 1-dehydrogenase
VAIREKMPEARFVIVGDGPLRAALEKQYPWIHFAGMRRNEDLARHYASADVFLFPSETETFVAARLEIDDWRWAGVPFYLRAGKRLPKRATEIAIQFKDVPQHLFPTVGDEPEPNLLVIRIQPDEGILMRFAAKVPGLGIDVRPVNMDFAYGSAFTVESPDAYETLILDALLGDASLFTRADEVEAAWRIVDPIIDAWIAGPEPELPNYTSGTWGPEAADELLTREGRRWRRL